jgi:hypothetical protein
LKPAGKASQPVIMPENKMRPDRLSFLAACGVWMLLAIMDLDAGIR